MGDQFLLSLSRAHRLFGIGVLVSSGRNVRWSWGERWGEKFKWHLQWAWRWRSSMSPSVCVLADEGPQGLFCGLELTDRIKLSALPEMVGVISSYEM